MKQQLNNVLAFLRDLRVESLFKGHDKRREAIQTITDVQKELDRLEKLQETIADIAYMAGVDRFTSGNSRADVQHFIHIAKKFEEEVLYRKEDDTDDEDTPEYMDAIEEFCKLIGLTQ